MRQTVGSGPHACHRRELVGGGSDRPPPSKGDSAFPSTLRTTPQPWRPGHAMAYHDYAECPGCSEPPRGHALPAVRCKTASGRAHYTAPDLRLYPRVLIAPTRDRNVFPVISRFPGGAGPHRPYEGSQRQLLGQPPQGCDRSSSPLRGIATTASEAADPTGPGSSSPLRGIATPCDPRPSRRTPPPSSPLRGIATLCDALVARRHGSSSPLRGIATTGRTGSRTGPPRSSSPLRGIATYPSYPLWAVPGRVLIAPTRDRNVAEHAAPLQLGDRPHRPYEGSQLDEWLGDATQDLVLIAPTRDSNLDRKAEVCHQQSSSPLRGIEASRCRSRTCWRVSSCAVPDSDVSRPEQDQPLPVPLGPVRGRRTFNDVGYPVGSVARPFRGSTFLQLMVNRDNSPLR